MLPESPEPTPSSPQTPAADPQGTGTASEHFSGAGIEQPGLSPLLGEGARLGGGEELPAPMPAARGISPVSTSVVGTGPMPTIVPGAEPPHCVQCLDLDGNILTTDAGSRLVLGDDVLGTGKIPWSWTNLWRGPAADEAARAIAAARTGRTEQFQGSLATAVGVSKYWEATLSPIPGNLGAPERLLASLRPARAGETGSTAAHAGSDAEFRAAFHQATVGIATTDLQGRVLWANDAFCQLIGYTFAEILGRDSRSYSHPEDVQDNAATIRRIQEQDLPHAEYEKRYLHRSGRVVWARINLAPVRDTIGRVASLIAVIEDVTERRHGEQELVNVQRRLDAALTAGEIGTWVYEIPADRVYADNNLARLFFVPAEQAIQGAPLETFTRSIHADDQARVSRDIGEAMATGGAYETEYRVVGPAGEVRWLAARGTVELDAAGKAVRFYGVVLDVTGRQLAQQALAATGQELAQQSRLFNAMLSSIDDYTYLIDAKGRFLYANRALLELYGLTLAELTGRDFYNLPYEKWHADLHMREVQQVVTSRKLIKGEIGYRGVTGEDRFFEYTFSPVIGENGDVEAIAGTSHDVTAQRQSRDAVREGKERLALALDAAQLGTFDWALPEGSGPIDWNRRMRDFYWVAYDVTITREVLDRCVHPADLPAVRTALDRSIYHGDRYDIEYRVVGPEGQLRWVRVIGKSFLDDKDVPVRFGGIVMDVTLRKLAEEEREKLLAAERAARADAERSSKMKDEFLATLSHELRTPLNAILGWAQVLRITPSSQGASGDGAPVDEDLDAGLATIERNARAQAQIIDDLLDMSRIISGKVRLDVQRVDLAPVVQASIDTMMPAAQAKGIRLQSILDPHARPVSGDPNRLQQVFWNILSNAIKFTPRDGRIQVTLARVNSHLEVSVSDTGAGIAAEFLPHVFDRFRQADSSSTRRHGGLGLGLAIVKQLVELHGGTVRVSSAGAERGSSFVVSLPLLAALEASPEEGTAPGAEDERRHPQARFAARAEDLMAAEGASAAGAPAKRLDLRGLRVLVVDDEADARELLKCLLEDRGAQVLVAGSAQAAYELAVGGDNPAAGFSPPDVLVSDIGMPGEDGYSLIRRLRAHEAEETAAGRSGTRLPAVALTAYARAEDRMKAVLAGFQMHISKPVEAAELLAMVASLTGRV